MAKSTSFIVLDEHNVPVVLGSPIKDPTKLIIKIKELENLINPMGKIPIPDTPQEERIAFQQRLGLWTPHKELPNFNRRPIPFQKILIVKLPIAGVILPDIDTTADLLREDATVRLLFQPLQGQPGFSHEIDVRVLRVSDFLNPNDEYYDRDGAIPTKTILIEWSSYQNWEPYGTFSHPGIVFVTQSDNFWVTDPPNNKPGDPIIAATEDDLSDSGYYVRPSQFQSVEPTGTIQPENAPDPVVAIVDTGIKTVNYPMNDANGTSTSFKLIEVPNTENYRRGYCTVTDYLRAANDSDPALDIFYREQIPDYRQIHSMNKSEIKNSVFDDHLVYNNKNEKKGRHGTTIAAIVNQKADAAVLPVKVFNYGGNGTLYDLLCGLNYIYFCYEQGVPVRVINLSFAGALSEEPLKILRNKFRSLARQNIWSIAAAGNNKKELKLDPDLTEIPPQSDSEVWHLFPACFSKELGLNVITVTSVEEEVRYRIVRASEPIRAIEAMSRQKQTAILKNLGLSGQGYRFVREVTYKVMYNYSKDFVNIGVVGPFPSVFKNALSDLSPTSFTTAFFAARVAEFLRENPSASRSDILNHNTFSGQITHGEIEANRLIRFQ